ncbi:MAG: 4-hydroxy-3-methylbut-2-enyl diphosphate reductase [Candidatus Omnitrophica bacterium]|nr:4-hydroxy-3-methylbut-2-enyl diphosphate reductase [Candidatus Omnitrophota bacterium]
MVITAKEIGFCFGVKRAVSLCEKTLKNCKTCVSLGPIIHNEQVIEKLERSGLKIAASICSGAEPVIIRSHGLHPDIRKELVRKKRKIIDATCPFVRQVQQLVAGLNKRGYAIIIIGKPDHPEVKALAGFAGKKVIIYPAVRNTTDGLRLKFGNTERVAVVSQTTNTERSYRHAFGALQRQGLPAGTSFFDTVCRVTERRQTEASQLAKKVDVLLVVGSGKSANTTNLYRFLRRMKPETYLISGAAEVKDRWRQSKLTIGLVSGTSTPKETIEEVKRKICIQPKVTTKKPKGR